METSRQNFSHKIRPSPSLAEFKKQLLAYLDDIIRRHLPDSRSRDGRISLCSESLAAIDTHSFLPCFLLTLCYSLYTAGLSFTLLRINRLPSSSALRSQSILLSGDCEGDSYLLALGFSTLFPEIEKGNLQRRGPLRNPELSRFRRENWTESWSKYRRLPSLLFFNYIFC